MKNPSEMRKFDKIVGGSLIADDSKKIDIPAKTAIQISTQAMFLNGEMSIAVDGHTAIREDGQTKARIDNKYPRILVSKGLSEGEQEKAVKQYMQEKDIQSIKDIIKEQEEKAKVSGEIDR